jgi:hypothetical protein
MSDSSSGAPYSDDSGKLGEKRIEMETVTNDAVAGETVLPGPGDGNDGPTGGAEREGSPIYDEHDPQIEPEVELDDEPDVEPGHQPDNGPRDAGV